jgi:recombination protein RecA
MERERALDAALSQIEKRFGKGSVMKMGENPAMSIEVISTGAMALDMALGIGGLPRGRIVEIYGPESSGKSTLALHVVAEAQRNGGICAYIDAEYALDPVYARAIGVDVDELLISQPDNGEQALEIADVLIRSGSSWSIRSRRSRHGRRSRGRWATFTSAYRPVSCPRRCAS